MSTNTPQHINQTHNTNNKPRVDVVEFVSGEHTPRNLLIRAARRCGGGPPPAAAAAAMWREYEALKAQLGPGVVPALERMMLEDGTLRRPPE